MSLQFIGQPALRPASDLVFAGDLGLIYGLIGGDLDRPQAPLAESVEGQTRQIMSKLDALLAAQGLTRAHVVAVTVWLRDFHRFEARFEKVWAQCFDPLRPPTRQLAGATALVREALVSMDFVISRRL